MEQAEDVVFLEAVAAFEKVEFHGEGKAGDLSAELLDEFHGRFHGAAGGEEVVDEHDSLAGLDGVLVDFQRVGTVLQVVSHAGDGRRELAGLADRDEAGVEPVGESGAKDEAASLDAEDEVDLLFDVVSSESVNEFGEAGLVFEQRGDVVEEDARLGKIGYGAHKGFELFDVDRLRFGHRLIIKGDHQSRVISYGRVLGSPYGK